MSNVWDYTVEECEAEMRRLTNGERGCAYPEEHTPPYSVTQKRYSVSIADRINELMPFSDIIGPSTKVSYIWDHGYETLIISYDKGGSSEYRGSYHPDSTCDTGTSSDIGVCIYCGATLQ